MIAQLHFITQENEIYSHLRGITAACEAGVKWVQLRIKDKTEEEISEQSQLAREICDRYGVKLIINDYPEIAKKVNADGVHLGKNDMPVANARHIVGNKMIIGATANTLEDIISHADNGADYIGLGPFRYTSTKKNLSPILGIEGYVHIMKECARRAIDVPIIAIGGIEREDIAALMETGVYGVALSGLIVRSNDMSGEVEKINSLLKRD